MSRHFENSPRRAAQQNAHAAHRPHTDEMRATLIRALAAEHEGGKTLAIPHDTEAQRTLLRALVNVRPPAPIDEELLALEDRYLQARLAERGGAIDSEALAPVDADDPVWSRVALWQGDITLLAADAIVNAANSQVLGCFVPGHHCIDNAIHTYAGMRLRLACAELMRAQGHEEPTGRVKVTPGFNLPARYVFHTVGPVVENGSPTARDRSLLKSCYRSCLEEATRQHLSTLALCCISTGIFGFPQREAARIALAAALDHLEHRDPTLKVVFDVYLDADKCIYQELIGRAQAARPRV